MPDEKERLTSASAAARTQNLDRIWLLGAAALNCVPKNLDELLATALCWSAEARQVSIAGAIC